MATPALSARPPVTARDSVLAMGIAALRAAALAARQDIPAPTTIAVKRAVDQVASAVMTASASSMTVVKDDAHLANPWLRAIVLSPSVKRFLTTVALGDRDFRALASLMVKPRNAVKMTFSADPNPGLCARSTLKRRRRTCSCRRSITRRRPIRPVAAVISIRHKTASGRMKIPVCSATLRAALRPGNVRQHSQACR